MANLRNSFIFCVGLFALTNECIPKESTDPHLSNRGLVYFDLPEQSLIDSIIEFSVQSNFDIALNMALAKGHRSRALTGRYTVKEALQILIQDAPLGYSIKDDQSFIQLFARRSEESTTHKAIDPGSTHEEELLVVGAATLPFRYTSLVNSLTHSNVQVFDSVRKINTLSERLIVERKPQELFEILKHSSSVAPADGYADSNDDFYIRGFPRHAVYVDGFRLESATGTKIQPALVERVEIIKGPSTLYFGQAEPGGVVNVIRKSPQEQASQMLSMSLGTHDLTQLSFDSTGRLGESRYRFIYTNQSQDMSRELNDIERELVSLAFASSVSKSTDLKVNLDYQRSNHNRRIENWFSEPSTSFDSLDTPDFSSAYTLADFALTHYSESGWLIQASYFKNRENIDGFRGLSSTRVSSHALSDNLELYQTLFSDNARFTFLEHDQERSVYTPAVVIDAFPREETRFDVDFIKLNADVSRESVGVNHNLSLGFDARLSHARQQLSLARKTPADAVDSIGYTGEEASFLEGLLSFDSFDVENRHLQTKDYGLYIRDNIDINEHWVVSLGARWVVSSGTIEDDSARSETKAAESLEEVSELANQVGFVFKPNDAISLFTNYSEAVRVNYTIDNLLVKSSEPERSKQFEFGIKSLAFNGNLLSTASLFRIEKSNVLRAFYFNGIEDPSDERRVDGIDVDLNYQHGRHFNLIAAASFLKPKVISRDETDGNMPAQSNKQTYSIFMSYQFNPESNNKFGINMGAYSISKRFVDNENTSMESAIDSPFIRASQPMASA